ncbi:F-box protein At3g07870-like [Lolium perenne]|uniref:F-box protein At3g07870-like n=1 Tax=Lolium perenne TaxID=4522 RepID=UPI0021F55421|nr:F-box protein At3g07870-like [Lolium perenne]
MGSGHPEPESKTRMEPEIPRDILREILVKLPTKDLARSRCVCRLWRRVASRPSLHNLHAMASHVTSARTEALLVTVREPGWSDEASVFSVSSGKAMCCVPIPRGYGLVNVCNGFLCFAHRHGEPKAPAVVCNPITGETVALPKAPPLITHDHMFALGFSPSTREYKLFRLSYPLGSWSSSSGQRVEVDVYTLGDTRWWRHHSFNSQSCPSKVSSPVSIDGKLYLVTLSWMHYKKHEIPKRILAIDVATESYRTYNLPEYETRPYNQPTVGAFELNGRLCFAAHIINFTNFMTIHFWVMSPPLEDIDLEGDHQQPSWELRYSFHMEGHHFCFKRPWGCWLDDQEMMCYLMDNILHKYDTRKSTSVSKGGFVQWDKKLYLAEAPSLDECSWNVLGGYRPTLLSPLSFQLAPSQDDDGNKHQFEHDMLTGLRL